jgi:glycosyltransferase involved in cell wall biosynthesis
MKIAVDSRMSGMSGIGVFLDNILSFFISERSSIHTFLLIGRGDQLEKYLTHSNCSIIRTDIKIFSIKEQLAFPTKEINQCDVFFSPNYNIPAGIHIPIYSTIHDVVFLDVKGLVSPIGRLIRHYFLWRALRWSKKIFTVSEFSRQRILCYFKGTLDIIVVKNGIGYSIKNYVATEDAPYPFEYILYVGNIKKHKGLSLLFEAFKQAESQGFSKKLVVVGEYKDFRTKDKTILKILDKEGKDILFTGKIPDNQLYNLMAHASLLVQPSFYEGFGLSPLEALYLGCPVLISDIPVFHEIYDGLPVTFFNVNDVNDLTDKILLLANITMEKKSIKNIIEDRYDFDRSANLILNQLMESEQM